MGATIQRDKSGILVLRITGALRKEEMDDVQAAGIRTVGDQGVAKVLALISEDFRGWVGGEVWGDMTFFMEHGDQITKIAIVGDDKWKAKMLMFTGAGFRRAPVKYFSPDQLSEAYAWLE